MGCIKSFRWGDGYIIAKLKDDDLVIEGGNSVLGFSERGFYIRGLYEGVKEYDEGPKSPRKLLYILLAFPLKGVGSGQGVVYQRTIDTYCGRFGISYTTLGSVGEFLTIYPPPGSLYDYVVISNNKIFIYLLKRRKIYEMRENDVVRFILL